jgi:mono/diheme cytochrome c family protein
MTRYSLNHVGTAAIGCPAEQSSAAPPRSMRYRFLLAAAILLTTSCSYQHTTSSEPKPTAFGVAIVESSGGKQVGQTGGLLPQPVVVQVNDDKGTAVAGALVEFSAAPDVVFDPASALTDSSGQVTTNVSLGGMAGRYQIVAATSDKAHKKVELKIEEIALGYQQTLGRRLNDQYCERCHNPESTVERVSNYDNLEVKPHPFTDGDTLNRISDSDLTAIISHGGPALNKSALMPAWGNTLSKSDIQALISYIHAISDPPSRNAGPVYAKN